MRAGIYCRISDDRDGTHLGVDRQRRDCEDMVARRGWQLAQVYVDNDISAYSGKPRPRYRQLLADIESHAIDALVVWHLDRLHRQPKELESFIDLVERSGIALASVSGEHNLATPEGRLHARILGAVARMESEHKSRRIRRQKLEMIKAGRPLGGGYRGFGYERDRLTIVPAEAEALREATARILAGESLRSIVLDFNSRGIRTTQGHPWIGRSLRRLLTSPRVAGLVQHPETGLLKAMWPPILTREEQARIQAMTDDRRRSGNVGPPRRYLLSGLLRCGECGTRLVSVNARNRRGRAYGCPPPPAGCNHVLIVAGWAEDFIREAVFAVLDNPIIEEQAPTMNVTEALDAIAADRQLLDEIAAAYAERQITMPEWLSARRPIEARIAEANQRIIHVAGEDSIRQLVGRAQTLREHWTSLDVERQRSVLATVLDEIHVRRVGRGSYMDPTRLTPVWRV